MINLKIRGIIESELPQRFLNLWNVMDDSEQEKLIWQFANYFGPNLVHGEENLQYLAELIRRNFQEDESFWHSEFRQPGVRLVCELRRRLDVLSYTKW